MVGVPSHPTPAGDVSLPQVESDKLTKPGEPVNDAISDYIHAYIRIYVHTCAYTYLYINEHVHAYKRVHAHLNEFTLVKAVNKGPKCNETVN